MITIVRTEQLTNTENTGEASLNLPSSHLLVVRDQADNEYQIATNEDTCAAVNTVLDMLKETSASAGKLVA